MLESLDVPTLYEFNNLVAWCIVPYDACNRNATQRAAMLKRLGITKIAWDWRKEHLSTASHEFEVMSKEGIDIVGVWIWVDVDSVPYLSVQMEQLVQDVIHSTVQTRLWIGFASDTYEDITHESDRLMLVCEILRYINTLIEGSMVTMALYNHGGWLGLPKTMLSIIELSGLHNLGIVYNLHHAHNQLEDLEQNLKRMMPFLVSITMNGMNIEGPQIRDIGSGSLDVCILNTILNSGYKGHIALLGHTEGEDVEKVLDRNLKGLSRLAIEHIKSE
jgi:predicted membrane channel-forming protein YqfA (hemolysin III family)